VLEVGSALPSPNSATPHRWTLKWVHPGTWECVTFVVGSQDGTPTPKVGVPFGSVKVYSLTLSCTLKLPSLPTTLQPPCLGCEPKARVVTTISYVEWHKFKSPKGFTPSNVNSNRMFLASTTKYGHFPIMCFQLWEFDTLSIRPFVFAPSLCQINNYTKVFHMYIYNSCGMNGTFCELSTNLLVLHFGHTIECFKVPLKNTTICGTMNGIITQTKFFN
jgi:hypothetical protein